MSTRRKALETSQVYGEGTERLSQLSDIVSLSQENELPSQPLLLDGLFCSQGAQELQETLPSQPLLPTPELPASASGRADVSGAKETERPLSRFASRREGTRSGKMFTILQSTDSMAVEPKAKQGRKATRRGPMDEMRQLVRILVKVIPHSAANVKACEEGGGGNRISEDQIKNYLSATLGDAPRPRWGVPDGWGAYLAELFSWVADRHITKEQAMRCAKREPGRSWEAIDSELAKLGLLPATWPLPLSRNSLGSALVPASQGIASPARSSGPQPFKRCSESPSAQANLKRVRYSGDVASDELGLWTEALDAVNAAVSKAGSSSPGTQMAVAQIKAQIHAKVQVPQPMPMPLLLSSQPPQIVPVSITGPGGDVQTAYTLQLPTAAASMLPPVLSQELPNTDCGAGLSLSQVLLSQPVSSAPSAFQAVKPSSPQKGAQERLGSQLLDAPPPLRLSPLHAPAASEQQPPSPSTEDEDNSAVFHSSQLSSPRSGPCSNLFRPTALKTDLPLLDLPNSQGESRPIGSSSPTRAEQPAMSAPVLGFLANGQFLPLGGAAALQGLAMPGAQAAVAASQPPASMAALSQARASQSATWVPNLAASLS